MSSIPRSELPTSRQQNAPRSVTDKCGAAQSLWLTTVVTLAAATSVLDAFHVVNLGSQVVDEVRGRAQQTIPGHRGRKDDPLYKTRNVLRCAEERFTVRQQA